MGLEEKWNDIDRKAIHYEVKYQESEQTLGRVRSGIESVFRRVGCTAGDLPSGCGTGITASNMMHFVAVIEGRVNELIKMYDSLRTDEEEPETASRPARTVNSSSSLPVKLPSTVEDYSDDEDDQRPFTRDELKTKTMRGITKKQKKSKTKGA